MAQIYYTQSFIDRINKIYEGGYSNLSNIASFPQDKAQEILREILETGCQSGNYSNIELAQATILELPEEWLLDHLPYIAENYLFKDKDWQEWEVRRLAEMLHEHFFDCFQ